VHVTIDDAIGIYARASLSWFGVAALTKTQQRIEALAKAGDIEGASVHERVKLRIIQLESQPESRARAGVWAERRRSRGS